jgi:hypothetical protein
MTERAPAIDTRTAAEIEAQVKTLLREYYLKGCEPAWDETKDCLGAALIKIFARFAEIVIERLNQVPEKNLLAFLDLLGTARLPPQPARVPLTFSLSAGAAGDTVVPAGTQVSGAAAEGGPPVLFETERELTATAAQLTSLFVRDAVNDMYSRATWDNSGLVKTASGGDLEAFHGDQEMEHILYLGHRSLFAHQDRQTLSIEVTLAKGVDKVQKRQLIWEIYNGIQWVELKPNTDTTEGLTKSGGVDLALPSPLLETTVNSVTRRWLRCRLTTIAPKDKPLPEITRITLSGKLELPLDAAFADGSPLDLSKGFFPFGERPKFGSILYLAQGEIFSRAGAVAVLSITLNKPSDYLDENTLDLNALSQRAKPELSWEYWNGRTWSKLTVTDNTEKFTKLEGNTLEFTVPPDSKATAVNGIESYWVRARITAGGYGQESGYRPFVGDPNITGTIEGSFDQNAGTLTGKIESTATGTSGTISATITGSAFSGMITGTIIGTINGTIADMKMTATITAAAVGRVTGTITGSAEGAVANKKITGTVKATLLAYRYASTLVPPSIKAVTVSYKDSGKVSPEVIFSYNDFTYTDVTKSPSFQPFGQTLGEERALYLGFTLPEGREAFPNQPLTLYFSVAETEYRPELANSSSTDSPSLAWEYWSRQQAWAPLAVEDETEALAHSGTVVWLPPADIAPRADFGLPEQYRLRIRLKEGDYPHPPRLRRVLLNTPMAAQTVTLSNEILGSSDASKGQRFRANHAPVLPGQRLEVWEPDLPTASECAAVREDEGEDAIEIPEGAAPRPGFWVRWHEVPDFYGSEPRDRHYVLDHLTGEVRFGDGINGLIPPRGVGNVRLTRYQTGGGAHGNLPAGALAQLTTTLPYVDQVVNWEPAAGGADAESLEALRERAPRLLRHGDRAVTRDDYEDLAIQASPEVARAHCVPLWDPTSVTVFNAPETQAKGGHVTVVVLPGSASPKPIPSIELIRRVQAYLDACRLPDVKLHVIGPPYLRVTVTAEVVAVSLEAASQLDAIVKETLARFLHPLTGGFDGRGWPWGLKPHPSSLYRCIEAIPGVDHVQTLIVKDEPDSAQLRNLSETNYFLVYSGEHIINRPAAPIELTRGAT